MKIIEELSSETVDLAEYLHEITKHKVFIFIFTFVSTFTMLIYQYFQEDIPIYKGSLMVEIGEKNTLLSKVLYLDKPIDLKIIIETIYPSVNIKAPYHSNKIFEITAFGTDKNMIKNNIWKAYDFIINRHKEKLKLYEKYTMTKKISKIKMLQSYKKNKSLIIIITFIASFLISVYLVLFISYFIKPIVKK